MKNVYQNYHLECNSPVPGPVMCPRYHATSNTSVCVTWGKPDSPNGEIVSYSVKYEELEGTFTTLKMENTTTSKLENLG